MEEKMKKVGIVTLIGNNYGGILQAYALKKYIEDLGFKVYHLNPKLKKNINVKELIKGFVYYKRNNKFKKYKKKFFKFTNRQDCDYYIAGSDQIWNPQIPFEKRKFFYLNFTNKKKISYAASIGTIFIDEDQSNAAEIRKLVSSFSNISVREETAKKVLSSIIENNIDVVLDPTLLINPEIWHKHAISKQIKSDYIFTYFLGLPKNIKEFVDSFALQSKCKIINVYYKKIFINELKHENNLSPQEFIGLIKSSRYVITNSFHGVVFSLIFHKKFYVITRGNMNSRIFDLLKKLTLEDRIINEKDILEIKYDINDEINYQKIDTIISKLRIESEIFLKNALEIDINN